MFHISYDQVMDETLAAQWKEVHTLRADEISPSKQHAPLHAYIVLTQASLTEGTKSISISPLSAPSDTGDIVEAYAELAGKIKQRDGSSITLYRNLGSIDLSKFAFDIDTSRLPAGADYTVTVHVKDNC